jgi:cytochrome P450
MTWRLAMSEATVQSPASRIDDFMPFNPFDPAFQANPYPYYKRLREESPVHRTPSGIVYISRYRDIETVLRGGSFGHSDGKVETEHIGWLGNASGGPGEAEVKAFFGLDPPNHTRLRGLVSKAFTARRIELLRPRIQQIVDDLLDKIIEAGEVNLVEEYAYPLPVTVICELLGVPPEDRGNFRKWSTVLARSLDPDFLLSADDIKERWATLVDFRNFFLDQVARRRKNPSDDLLSALMAVEEEGVRLTETEMLTTCSLLVIAGAETAVNFIANSTLALLRHPDQLAYLRGHLDDPAGSIEELLRFEPPVQLAFRVALEDVEIGGVLIEKDTMVNNMLGGANHDPDVFDDPDRLVLSRAPDRHLAFGLGIHFCFGAPLARMEGAIALSTMLRRAPDLALVRDDVSYKRNVLMRGIAELPVRLR